MAKKLKPIHPGEHLREDFMKPFGLSSNALGRALEVTPATSTKSSLNGAGIARIQRCGSTFLAPTRRVRLNLQSHYDLQCAEDAAGQAMKRIRRRGADQGDGVALAEVRS